MAYTVDGPGAPTHKMVNGARVDLTAEEKQAIVDEWNASEIAAAAEAQAEAAAAQKAADEDLLMRALPKIIQLAGINAAQLPAAVKAAYDRLNK